MKSKMVATQTLSIPVNKYYILDNCLSVDNIKATEYGLTLGYTHCNIRVKDNKILEMYFFDKVNGGQILSITENGYNTYTRTDNAITRDDGAIYKYTRNGLIRVSDNRTYTNKACNTDNLPNIVYVAYYFLYNSLELNIYREWKNDFDIKHLNISNLQKLLREINDVQNQWVYVNIVKSKLV